MNTAELQKYRHDRPQLEAAAPDLSDVALAAGRPGHDCAKADRESTRVESGIAASGGVTTQFVTTAEIRPARAHRTSDG